MKMEQIQVRHGEGEKGMERFYETGRKKRRGRRASECNRRTEKLCGIPTRVGGGSLASRCS